MKLGIVKVLIHMDKIERLLNICYNLGICLKDIHRIDETSYAVNIMYKDLERVEKITGKLGAKLDIVSIKGVNKFLNLVKKRIFLITGFAFAYFIMWFLSLYMWKIEIEGNYSYTKEQILDYLDINGISTGVSLNKIKCDDIEKKIRIDFDDITWVSVGINGTKLTIKIRENFNLVEPIIEGDSYNLCANMSGKIIYIVTRKGTPKVKEGDAVNAGDILVSGIVDVFDDYGELLTSKKLKADADIVIEGPYHFEETIDKYYEEKVYSGKKKRKISLFFDTNTISFMLNKKEYENYDVVSNLYNVSFDNNLYMPFGTIVLTYREYVIDIKERSISVLEEMLSDKYNEFCKMLEDNGTVIVNTDISFTHNEDFSMLSGEVYVWDKEAIIHAPIESEKLE